MPSWRIHEKWCQILGVEKTICQEVNRIVDRSPHDIVKQLLRKGWARNLFESGQAGQARTSFGELSGVADGDKIDQLTTDLAEITNRFGKEGIKATFNHIALDYIAELIEKDYDKEEIRGRLIKRELMDYLPYYEQVFDDISQETKPNLDKILRQEEFTKLAKKRICGVFYINNSLPPLSPAPALIKINSELKKGRAVNVKWGISSHDAWRGQIKRTLHKIEDLKELISEMTGQ